MDNNLNSPVTDCDNSGKGRSHPTTEQSHLFDFDSSSNFPTIPEPLTTSEQEPGLTPNPFYSRSCRRGYSLYNDPFNPFKLQEQHGDNSRTEISKAYRLQRIPKGASKCL
ncbi:hypothetical protein SDC9_167562 [bioreactor metagenome]|uniref:Uncharacterized protein n=1 Tax=bioreactor metagenome TaxID=1076179 RepID=A0A645G7U8_9ZZZZ